MIFFGLFIFICDNFAILRDTSMKTKKILFTILFLFVTTFRPDMLLGAFSPSVDVVYTWVDDQDPAWQQVYNRTKIEYGLASTPDSKVKSRFRSRDELRFSMRSLHAFAPFVHHIYIVTFGQTPSWLKSHKKVTVVHHKEIFKDPGHLPTFNSQAIESQLHRIPGLKEHFIYFNDDVFLGRKVSWSDFYTKHDKIKVLYEKEISPSGPVLPTDIAFVASWKNANRLLDAQFGYKARKVLCHAPFALKKSHLQKLEAKYPAIFSQVASHKFRSPEDFVITCGLVQNYAKHLGSAKKGTLTNVTIPFLDDLEANRKKLKMLFDKKPHTFCIEDIANTENAAADYQLTQFLNTYFPQKAPWEK